ncbi:MAG: hypothetical protein LQ338_000441 [Usnochroma carphineum]|nr:MAG: hypothetical protein LQ338_000441 [Usnochroma carphineum]
MASFSIYTSLNSFLSEPSAFVPQPSLVAFHVPESTIGPSPACIAGPSLCPDGPASPIYVGLGTEEHGPGSEEQPPLAPMPFATPQSMQLTVTALAVATFQPSMASNPSPIPTTTLTSIVTNFPSTTHHPSPTPASSSDPMMHGNPEPAPTYLHTSTIVGIAINSVLALSIIPLLVFSLVMHFRLEKAKAFQLGQGSRREGQWGSGWQGDGERRRELAVEGKFLGRFRRKVQGRAFVGQRWI